jgi:hypothetical protein
MRAAGRLELTLAMAVTMTTALGCSYRAQPVSGQQACAPPGGKRCPDGYTCQASAGGRELCWRSGEGPGGPEDDGGVSASDGAPGGAEVGPPRDSGPAPDLPPPVPAPSSRALAAGATISQSTTYRAIRTLGQPPGGNTVRTSATYRSVGGLVGATQK